MKLTVCVEHAAIDRAAGYELLVAIKCAAVRVAIANWDVAGAVDVALKQWPFPPT